MSFRNFFNRTDVVVWVILSFFSVLSVAFSYKVLSVYNEKKLVEYKHEYFSEQTYRFSYFINRVINEDFTLKENKKILEALSKEFSLKFELLDKSKEEILYQTKNLSEETNKDNLYSIDVSIIDNGEEIAYMRAHYDMKTQVISPALEIYQKKWEDSQRSLTIIILLALLMTSFIIAMVISKVMKPINDASIQVIKGNRDVHIPRSGTLEMKNLVGAVNSVLLEFHNMEEWRKQMMEDLTHELRTPLTSVLMMLEAIIDGVYPTSEKNLQDIYAEVERLSRLIFNVQNLSEAEGAKFKLNKREVNLINLIKSTYEGFLFVANQKEIDLYFNHPKRPCSIEVDPDRFVQVITNLISNALKYTPRKGTVEIGLEIEATEVVFYCLDNGIGISEEDQTLVFNRFYRAEKSRSRENGGTGIGLNISNALARAQGWDIGVESVLGEGSRFWIKIPIEDSKRLL